MAPHPNRRADDHDWSVWIRDKVLPPLLVTFIVAAGGGGIALYRKIDGIAAAIEAQEVRARAIEFRVGQLESEVTVVRSQMVGWDTLTRMERSLAALAGMGKGNDAMRAVAGALRSEIESRKEAPK